MQVPETLLGTAIATAMLPTLAEFAARQDWISFRITVQTRSSRPDRANHPRRCCDGRGDQSARARRLRFQLDHHYTNHLDDTRLRLYYADRLYDPGDCSRGPFMPAKSPCIPSTQS